MQWPEPLASSPTVSIDAFVLLIHEQLQFLCALSGRIQDAFIGAQSRAGTALRITIELAVCITKRYPGTFRFKQCFFAIWRECGHQPFIILVELSILTSRFGDDAIYHVERNPIGLVEAGRVFWTQVLLGCGGERFGAQSKGQADHYSCFYNHLNLVCISARGGSDQVRSPKEQISTERLQLGSVPAKTKTGSALSIFLPSHARY